MCQRKIISQDSYRIVPLLNGCGCPHIKEFRNVEAPLPPAYTPKERSLFYAAAMNYCYDMHTQLPAAHGHHVVFRHCVCNHYTGLCMKLPPLLYIPEEEDLALFDDDSEADDDQDDSTDMSWGVGGPGGIPNRPVTR